MLLFLSIRNFLLIKKAELDFASDSFAKNNTNKGNLTIVSGETGSGKSILLEAISLVVGYGKAGKSLVGRFADSFELFAEFDISNNDECLKLLASYHIDNIYENDKYKLVIRRICNSSGAGKIYINDSVVSVSTLEKIGSSLLEINAQHSQIRLFNKDFQRKIIDDFANNHLLLKDIRGLFVQMAEIDRKIKDFAKEKEQKEKDKHYLSYIIKEISDANIQENEEENLILQKSQIANATKSINLLETINKQISQSVLCLGEAEKAIGRNYQVIEESFTGSDIVDSQVKNVEDLTREIEDKINSLEKVSTSFAKKIRYIKGIDTNISEIEERLFIIRNLSRKFNCQSFKLSEILDDAKSKLLILEGEEQGFQHLTAEKQDLLLVYQDLSSRVSARRIDTAKIVAKLVEKELQFLKMPNAKFVIDITRRSEVKDSYFIDGNDDVKFLSAINDDRLVEISKVASGGEISRFLLAIKVALLESNSVPTIVFDEIDSGVGGNTASAIGSKLSLLASKFQLLVVTHQPQIAAKADCHFAISKKLEGDSMVSSIQQLNRDECYHEVARMLAGEIVTPEAVAAAKKLIFD
jgi:DNA repair protein RecN (Recombination protein N)